MTNEYDEEYSFYSILTFGKLIEIYEREGFLAEALEVAELGAQYGQVNGARERLISGSRRWGTRPLAASNDMPSWELVASSSFLEYAFLRLKKLTSVAFTPLSKRFYKHVLI